MKLSVWLTRYAANSSLLRPLKYKQNTGAVSGDEGYEKVHQAIIDLQETLNGEKNLEATAGRISYNDSNIDVFMAFDEAHTLANTIDGSESRIIQLRRVLSHLNKSPLYAFFLSTAGNVTQFGHVGSLDQSSRVQRGDLRLPKPYIYLGFDQLMKRYKFSPKKTLHDVTSMEYVAHMGRPL